MSTVIAPRTGRLIADVSRRRQFQFVWHAIDADVPMVHQQFEAVADLMDELRTLGLVLTDCPHLDSVVHGCPSRLTLTCHVRAMTAAEARVLKPKEKAA